MQSKETLASKNNTGKNIYFLVKWLTTHNTQNRVCLNAELKLSIHEQIDFLALNISNFGSVMLLKAR